MRLPNPDSLNLRDSFRDYTKQADKPIKEMKEYLDIVYGLNKFIMELVHDGHTVILPEQMGEMNVQGDKRIPRLDSEGNIVNLPVDWKSTKELWSSCDSCKEEKQLLFHFNEHTAGVVFKPFWSMRNVKVENKRLYSFKFTRSNSREVKKKIVDEGKEYTVNPKKLYLKKPKNI